MSKAIIIQQNGVDKNLSVDKLLIPTVGGGNEYWVPEESVALSPLTVTANGSYSAASASKYGYDYVSVSVPGSSVTGKGSDGNTHVITKDPNTGRIVDTKVPSSLRIITPPDYIGPYGEGANLSFDGLSVEALYADGTSAGVVPFSELQFPVTVAHYDPEAEPLITTVESDLDYSPITTIGVTSVAEFRSVPFKGDHDKYTIIGPAIATGISHRNRLYIILASTSSQSVPYTYERWFSGEGESDPPDYTSEGEWELSYDFTYDGKTVYYSVMEFYGSKLDAEETLQPTHADVNGVVNTIAWTMIYGDVVSTSGGVQIPVQWPRTGDGLVLETAFGITVVDIAPSGTND